MFRHPSRVLCVFAMSVSLTLGATANAQSKRDAVRWAEEARTAYEEGRYEDAAELLEKAFEVVQEPSLIWNTARAYKMAQKDELVVANKMDLTGSEEGVARLREELGIEVLPISGVTGRGLDVLTERIWQELHPEEP